jgi:predicted peroxiredoxin
MPVHADNHQKIVDKVLVIVSDSSLQTQGMAMVLGNTMSDQGAEVNVLLCDSAGDLALSSYQGEALKPKDLTPGQMLRRLIKQGASVNVCALYLPNSRHTKDDLLDGVNVASPPDMAAQMLNPSFRVFSF